MRNFFLSLISTLLLFLSFISLGFAQTTSQTVPLAVLQAQLAVLQNQLAGTQLQEALQEARINAQIAVTQTAITNAQAAGGTSGR